MSETFRIGELHGVGAERNLGTRQKVIASLTLTIGFVVLVTKIFSIGFLSPVYRHPDQEDWILIFALSLIIMLVYALVRSAGRVAAAEAEWQNVQRALQESRARLETIVENLPVGVAVAEASGRRIVLSNQSFQHLWRFPDAALGSVADDERYVGYHSDGRSYEAKDWPLARALEHGNIVLDEEMWISAATARAAASRPTRCRSATIMAA